jgi:Protein of unknown function (DUF2958)
VPTESPRSLGRLRNREALRIRPTRQVVTREPADLNSHVASHARVSRRLVNLCTLAHTSPRWRYFGYLSLAELESVRGPRGPLVERDPHFSAEKPLSAYTAEARKNERVDG